VFVVPRDHLSSAIELPRRSRVPSRGLRGWRDPARSLRDDGSTRGLRSSPSPG
jgi:hypothetical protein